MGGHPLLVPRPDGGPLRGSTELPDKFLYSSRFDDSIVFCYASRLSADTGAVSKFGSVNPCNAARCLPNVHALITALAPETGRPVAVLDKLNCRRRPVSYGATHAATGVR
ncbi:hypothetical protein ACFY1U_48590 [Streptomyces sp. NPDC001351]|uniref:hypothetical protein n=1 Tax=Streptomyces sp. NPDC001351 TaxID=3364564 RepID=UPI0036C26676